MGSNDSNPRVLTAREDDLQFYIDLDDPYMGPVSIYTSKNMPLCYILKMKRQIKDSKIYNFFQRIENMQSPALVSLYGFQMNRHKCCDNIITETVTSYWEYYNFYFHDYLQKRQQKDCQFLQTQIWHIVHMCCQGATILRKNNCYYDFKPSTMVITPQGKLKLCWGHLMSQNRHMRYFRFFQTQQLQDFFYSPQQLELITNRQHTTKINLEKCSSFSVGMLLLQCLTLKDPFTQFYFANRKVSFKNIRHQIDTNIKINYSGNIVLLLKMLLAKDPKQRQCLHFVYEHFKLMLNDSHELRVCGGKKQQKKQHNIKNHHLGSDFSDTKTVKYNHIHKK